MSFLKDLKDVYDNNEHLVGKEELRGKDLDIPYMLLPIFHKTQKAHVEVTLSENGEFVGATVLDNGTTVIPVTLDSASRTSGISPHSIHDKLIYLDKNYQNYLKESKTKDAYHTAYMENLRKWIDSEYSHPFLKSVYEYLLSGKLIEDLVSEGILILDENNHLLNKWIGDKDSKPPILKVVTQSQADTFVRFRSFRDDGEIYEPWKDKTLWQNHIDFQHGLIEEYGLCYVTGEQTKLTTKHPSYIRNPADKAKLISVPTNSNLITYQGRFKTPEQAVSIGAETSLKAHNALKWLLEKQGYKIGNSHYLVFGSGTISPEMFLTELDALFMDADLEEQIMKDINSTEEVLSKKLHDMILGFQKEIPEIGNRVTILCLDSATDGRLSITEYMELDTTLYFEQLKKWQTTASWIHRTRGKNYIGSPSVYTIAHAAYGNKIKDNLLQKTVKRLIPCILDQRPIPNDIVQSVVHRAIKHQKSDEKHLKIQAIDVACSLIRHNQRGGVKMSLDVENTNRSYLFGRLLAISEYLEGTMIGWSRETNAERAMQNMYQSPATTWKQLQLKLRPYFHKKAEYKGLQIKCKKMIDEIIETLDIDGFTNKPLSPEFLVGYSTQKRDFFKKVTEPQTEEKQPQQ